MKLLLALFLAVTGFAADVAKPAFSSAKYDKDIAAFEAADKANHPPGGTHRISGTPTQRLSHKAACVFAPYQ